VPMPVVVQTREYGEAFYAELTGATDEGERKARRDRTRKALYGE